MSKPQARDRPIRCECGRVIAYERDGEIYIPCHRCKRDVPILAKIKAILSITAKD